VSHRSQLALFGGKKIRKKPFPRHPVLGEAEKKAVLKVVESGVLSGFIAKHGEFFLGGPKVKELEKLFSEYFGVKYALAVNSATAGLHAALAACGVGPGDEVIVPPYTMSASASAILMVNGVPRFVDIRDDIFSLDPLSLERAITPRTRALVVVHLFGHPAPMDEILAFAKKHRLKVVEDCAQAPGAQYKGKYVGTLGDVGVFSFNQHKTITTGEGGVVVTNDEAIALKSRLVRNHGEAVVEEMQVEEIANTLGWNYRMTEMEAALGAVQFKKLDRLTEHRQELARFLSGLLKNFEGLSLPVTLDGCTHAYFLYAIKYNDKTSGIPRERLLKALKAEGIPFGGGYVKPLYLSPLYQRLICSGTEGWPFTSIPSPERPRYTKGICPVAERLHEKELIHTHLCYYPVSKTDLKDVARAFEKIYDHRSELREPEPASLPMSLNN